MAYLFYDFGDEDFEYEVDKTEAVEAQLRKLYEKDLRELLLDLVGEDDLWDYFEDQIYEDNKDDAREQYNDALEYEKDPYGYYGLNESDFH